MKDKEKTKEQLQNELTELRQQITELQKSEIKHLQIEKALKKSQLSLASIFENIPQAVVYLNENGNIKNMNPRFTELFGYTLEEVKGKNINEGMIYP
jgi:PAS domain-containing protein